MCLQEKIKDLSKRMKIRKYNNKKMGEQMNIKSANANFFKT